MTTIKFNKEKVAKYILTTKIQDLLIISFLQENIDKDLILHSSDDLNLTYTVKSSENGKSYELPASLFCLDEEIDEDENEKESIQNSIKKHITKERLIIFGGVILTLGLILLKSFDLSSADNLTTGPIQAEIKETPKSQIMILTDELNKNNIQNSLKKEVRKKIIDDLKKIEDEIKEIDGKNTLILQNINLLTK